MRRASRHAPANAIFVVATADALPAELGGAVSELSVHFPWGSLLKGLVAPSPEVLEGIARTLRPGGTLTALLSLTERDGGTPLGEGSLDRQAYGCRGLRVVEWRPATTKEIIDSDSSWAKRLHANGARPSYLLRVSRSSS